jgi:hypothetical protein
MPVRLGKTDQYPSPMTPSNWPRVQIRLLSSSPVGKLTEAAIATPALLSLFEIDRATSGHAVVEVARDSGIRPSGERDPKSNNDGRKTYQKRSG